ncbi:MAG: hypothetical protein JKY61_05160 [Planctomycetes bacterium]|nr:hypothetical protein [Planctomycetota bacterium]
MGFVQALASALLGAGELQASQDLLRGWLRKLPGHPALLELQMRVWLKLGQDGAIEEALAEQLPRSLTYWKHGWRLKVLGQTADDVTDSPSWSVVRDHGANAYTLDYTFVKPPKSLSEMRLYLPNGFRGRLQSLELILTDGDATAIAGGAGCELMPRGMQSLGEGVFQASGKGGVHFEWVWPAALDVNNGLRVRVRLLLEATANSEILRGLDSLKQAGEAR